MLSRLPRSLVLSGVLVFCVTLLPSNFAQADSFNRMKVKNRAKLQEERGYYKDRVYKYVDDKDIDNAIRNRTNGKVEVGVVKIKRNSRIRSVDVIVDSKKKIKVNRRSGVSPTRNTALRIGVVEVGKRSRVKSIKTQVNARKGIEVR